jgi:tetratricopeptide (TPR) repeat protein
LRLRKYAEALQAFEESIKLDPKNASAWHGKGTALASLGRYVRAASSFNRTVQLEPEDPSARLRKAMCLANAKKYQDALHACDEALRLDENLAIAWTVKGHVLLALHRNEEAIKCFDHAIRSNPQIARAHADLGVSLMELRRFQEAEAEFKTAHRLYSVERDRSAATKARKDAMRAANASELLTRMNMVDKQFNRLLASPTLVIMKRRYSRTSGSLAELLSGFKGRLLPAEVVELVKAKANCLAVLGEALESNDPDLSGLNDARDIFRKWGFNTSVIAANSIENFILGLSTSRHKGKTLKDIPKSEEQLLLNVLNTSSVLDGILTNEISGRVRGEPYRSKPIDALPQRKVQQVMVAETHRPSARVAVVQVSYGLTKQFPYRIANNDERRLRSKVLEAVAIAKQQDVDIICFPEFSFSEGWIQEIKQDCGNMMVVCGSFYDSSNRNLCKIIVDGKDYDYAKCNPSILERKNGEGMQPGQQTFMFQTAFGRVWVLTCADFDTEVQDGQVVRYRPDIIVNPRRDPDEDLGFQTKADACIDLADGSWIPTYFLLVNSFLPEGRGAHEAGGTAIMGHEHKYRIAKFKGDGLRPADKVKYKLCQARGEMIQMADLVIGATPGTRAMMHHWYKYSAGHWELLKDKRIWK